jgi:hypothetical protein
MKFSITALLIQCCLLASCLGSRGASSKPDVDIQIINMSSVDIENAGAQMGAHQCKWGWVVKGGSKSYLSFPHAIGLEVTLTWDEQSRHRTEKMDLKKVYREGTSGRLIFTIYDERVAAEFHLKQ